MNNMVMKELKNFDISIEDAGTEKVMVSELLMGEKCLTFLQNQMNEINAPNLAVTASMVSKRYAFLVVSSTLYCIVKFNCAPGLSIYTCALSNERKLSIQSMTCKWWEMDHMDREQWREKALHDLFSLHITPFLNILNQSSRVSLSILWENVAIRINSIYRKTLEKELDPVKIERLKSDFHFLKNANGALFNLKENPIKKFLKIGEELKSNPYRKTCCMYYRLEKGVEGIGYCSNCPVKRKQTK
ncbi:ferric iron reductase protein FhuF [Bacillus pakistanensis]|uniref:Ferric iron reductase protein FhuF n=1 Tax=Rossellomorea pakistanensis TaxID=992288 RepID=A0ABS2N6P5_9BACI|nr:(2Fe-2S)-binding protein [Bacillus pakistanensis]MBM7583513.1 ferric iron reductase protein FhuF [Bacillus pakistanensis]